MELDQALFGYDRGHRLIASSRKLGKEATWVLRNVTDMKVPKRQGHFLTVLPVPDLDVHAFVRTWATTGEFRPGSVWSHVLLVPSGELDQIEDLRVLLSLFSRPQIDDPEAIGTLKSQYGKRIKISDASSPSSSDSGRADADGAVVDRLVLASYASDSAPAEVVVDDARTVEGVVLGLMGQRWSHLRRSFSARTRYRPSQTSAAEFMLEVVERGSGKSEPPPELVPDWATALASDLRQPNKQLRQFLRMHTQQPEDQPSIVARITDVFVSATRSPDEGVEAIRQRFPRSTDRIELKQDLFGPAASAAPISDTWPNADPERLGLLLSAPAQAFALSDYNVGSRLADWAKKSPVDAAVAVVSAEVAGRTDADVSELATGISTGFDTNWVAKLISTLPRLAPTLLAGRPDVWCTAEVWTTEVDRQLLLDLISQADEERRRATFLGLLSGGLASSAGELLATEPPLWWAIIDPDQAERVAQDHPVISGARRIALSVQGTRGSSPWPLTTLAQAMVIASVADPDEGLWRGVDPNLWVEIYKVGFEPLSDDMHGPVRRDVMALAAGAASNDPTTRRLLWSLVFPRLHQELLGAGTPLGCERTLAALLPDGPSWDWCGRLRYGLARIAVTDGWSEAELHDVARGAGDFAHEVAVVADAFRHSSNKSLFGEVVDFFTGWMR